MHDPRFGFVPPGHQAIMAIRVLHAWPHPSGAWLSIQYMGRVTGLYWRSADSYKATVCAVAVFDEFATLEQNYDAAFRCGEIKVDEGPPSSLLASAYKSAMVRKEKATAAAAERWKKKRAPTEDDTGLRLKRGPNADKQAWQWVQVDDAGKEWALKMTDPEADVYLYLDQLADGQYKLRNDWTHDVVFATATLEACFSAMESFSRRGPEDWKVGDKG